ncbi:transcriptional regulator NrdR [Rothia sp. AR01]|uniref:Transcriptional repressor NrdR n=1 Tax=Rothia santali TaxID=2949643 RepID=A0A9X2HIM9_9MICC|nr:transcriptional regulator NrdR [Rothia santali]MCP3425538.1 transcriptional regulator NrdR [Rothia santali]
MHCPYCRHSDSRVVDSRVADDGSAIRRRRQCAACGRRFSTLETTTVNVIKRSGATEPFIRSKIVSGVRKACQGRPVSEDDLALLAQEVEESIRARGLAEIDANDVGLAILAPLQRLDEIAYLRFASVYQAFEGLEDFERAIADLRGRAGGGGAEAAEPVAEDAAEEEAGESQKPRRARSSRGAARQTTPRRKRPAEHAEEPDQPRLL